MSALNFDTTENASQLIKDCLYQNCMDLFLKTQIPNAYPVLIVQESQMALMHVQSNLKTIHSGHKNLQGMFDSDSYMLY